MRRITNRAILAAVITAGSAWAATAADSKAAKIEKLVQAYYDTGRFRGSVLVTENGKVIFKKGFGMADAEWNIPNAPDTKFRLGSITKQFTATLILQLAEQGKVKLSGKIGDYLRDYPRKNGDRITIHHLLSHQSGIPNYTTPDFFEKNSRDHYSPVELARTFWDKDLEFEPGARFHYSNSGYHVLGMIVEQVTGKPYEMVLKEQFYHRSA